jgi:hypothetical protein
LLRGNPILVAGWEHKELRSVLGVGRISAHTGYRD